MFCLTLWNTRFCSLYIIVFFCPFFRMLLFGRFRAKLNPPGCGAKLEALLVIVFTWRILNTANFLRIGNVWTKQVPERSFGYHSAGSGCWRAGNCCFLSGGAYLLPTLLSGFPTRYPVGRFANTAGNSFGTLLAINLLTGWSRVLLAAWYGVS